MAETHKRYNYNSSNVRSQSFTTEQQLSAVDQVQSSQRWVEPNQSRVPNQCSNIRSLSGTSLSAHAKFDRTSHPTPRVLERWDFYFRSARIDMVTHRSANKRECRLPRLPKGCQMCFFDGKFHKFNFFQRQLV